MNKKKKTVFIFGVCVLAMCSGLIILNYISKSEKKSEINSEEKLVPESLDHIPPGIIDNVAPDAEQKFKAEMKSFEAHDENGNEVDISSYRGEYLILNFWSSTCDECTDELPYFEEAIKKYEGQVNFLNINIADGNTETKYTALQYLKDNNINISTVFDDHYDARISYKVTSLPRTIFIDKNGLIQKDIKFALNEETLEAQIQNLINSES